MAITNFYNHTSRLHQEGAIADTDTLRVALYSSLTFDETHTTKAAVDGAATELSTANGYTAGGQAIANLAANTDPADDSQLDGDPTTWNATGAGISAAYALVYKDDGVDDPPLFIIDFQGTESAGAGTPFTINWDATGILRIDVA